MTAAPPDLESRLRALIDGKAKPVGSLGRIEDLAVQLAKIQRTTSPAPQWSTHTIFAADHDLIGATAAPTSPSIPVAWSGLPLR